MGRIAPGSYGTEEDERVCKRIGNCHTGKNDRTVSCILFFHVTMQLPRCSVDVELKRYHGWWHQVNSLFQNWKSG